MEKLNTLILVLTLGVFPSLQAASMESMKHPPPKMVEKDMSPKALTPLPSGLPSWIWNKKKNHIFYKQAPYNYDIYNIKPLAYDLNAVAVGHAMVYEDMVTGKAATLDTETFNRINWVLKHPPKLMPDEANISPTFGRKYGVLEQVFDWTHILHAQTVDVLASTKLTEEEKEKEIEALWNYYFESVPYAVTPLPMNMGFLDSQSYSMAFREKYPKVNGLFWGYHWLQGVMYDMLWSKTLSQQRSLYDVIGERYHQAELYKTDRSFMPMFAEVSPRFSARFPHIANAFDNLHMLHDMVNDILASNWIPEEKKEEQILRAVWLVSAEAHKGEKPGDVKEEGGEHDHRFMAGMPGMGLMKHGTEEVMWMDAMGWISMADCHHCSMALPEGKDAWRVATVMAEGWTMRVRCALCARDMAAETKGRAVLHIATENQHKPLIIISDDAGNLTTDMPEAVFLEQPASHRSCHRWSRVFTSKEAFNDYVKENQQFKDSNPVTFQEWADLHGNKPDTYIKPEGPEGNPYDKKEENHP